MARNLLLVASPEKDANAYYATRFLAPDAVIYLEAGGKKILVASELEIERARKQARVDKVISYSEVIGELREKKIKPTSAAVIKTVAGKFGATSFSVPHNFPLGLARELEKQKIRLKPEKNFFPQRVIKTREEIHAIEKATNATVKAIENAVKTIEASQERGRILYYEGAVLTSEFVKKQLFYDLLAFDCLAEGTIVSCASQAAQPHEQGHGALKLNQTIVIDVFPRSLSTRYYSDLTRTVVKGRASQEVKKMHSAVLSAQEAAFGLIKDNASGAEVHSAVAKTLENAGFKTTSNPPQGFFHSTGHGVGLELHEEPSLSPRGGRLQNEMVVTVEPGLYYPRFGGVRIEDICVVEKSKCRILSKKLGKELEV